MKSINVEVGGLVSSLSGEGVRRKLLYLHGVHNADANYVAGSATIHLDERCLRVKDLRHCISECGYPALKLTRTTAADGAVPSQIL